MSPTTIDLINQANTISTQMDALFPGDQDYTPAQTATLDKYYTKFVTICQSLRSRGVDLSDHVMVPEYQS